MYSADVHKFARHGETLRRTLTGDITMRQKQKLRHGRSEYGLVRRRRFGIPVDSTGVRLGRGRKRLQPEDEGEKDRQSDKQEQWRER